MDPPRPMSNLTVFCAHFRACTEWWRVCVTCSWTKWHLCLFVPCAINKYSFHGLLRATFFTFLCFVLMILLFNLHPLGVPAVAQWVDDPACLCGGAGLIPSPAGHSGLRIRRCHSWGLGCSSSSDSIPGPETSMCCGVQLKKEKKKSQMQGWHYIWCSYVPANCNVLYRENTCVR